MVKIKVKRGLESNIGSITLDDGEFAVTTDTKKLFVGIAGAKICLGGASSLGDMLKSIYDTDNDGIVDSAENAQTLGGKVASTFAYSEAKGNVDLNTVTQSGMYRIDNTLINAPNDVSWGQLLVIHGGADTIAQIVTDYASNNIYWRSGNPTNVGGTGSWGAWRKIWHDGNFNPSNYMSKGPLTWNQLKGV